MPAAKKPTGVDVLDILKQAQKEFDLRVGPLTHDASEIIEVLTTGNMAIDNVIGVGGLPIGRSIELYGSPGSGKSTCLMQAGALLQQRIKRENPDWDEARARGTDEYILYNDYEQALDKRYASKLGLDTEHPSFLFSQPESFEQGNNVAKRLISSGKIRLAVWDSVAAMAPLASMSADLGKNETSAMRTAKMMSDLLKQLNSIIRLQRTCAVFINHEMELIDMSGRPSHGGPRKSTPGGRALKYYASVRLGFNQVKNIMLETTDPLSGEPTKIPVATNVKVKVAKNRVGPPFQECIVRVRFGKGFDNVWSAMRVLVANKDVKYSSGYFYFEKSPDLVTEDMPRQATGTARPYLRSEEKMLAFADSHPEWRSLVISKAEAIIEKNGTEGLIVEAEPEEDEENETPPSLVGEFGLADSEEGEEGEDD